jgi:threonine/homoserine/homoserine lactone efflux protein
MNGIFHHLGNALYWSALALAGILLFELPATIFAYLGFARLTSTTEALASTFIYAAMACLSWVAGKALRYVIGRT